MGEWCPQLRGDLLISRRDGVGPGAYVVKDPQTRRYFQFREPEIFIARLFDGATPLEDIRQGVERRFGLPFSERSLHGFVNTLRGLGLLSAPSADPKAALKPPRSRGSLFYLRWKLCDPDRLLCGLAGALRWLFTPAFVALSGAMIVVALGVTAAHYGTIGQRLPALWRTDFLVFAWIILLAILVVHEFAHALTCKHFGGHVHEMGFMLLFFHPAVYCNVSDAWLFPELRKRLWVTFAGAYFEMFLWSVATLVWWVADPNTLLGLLALIVMLTSGVKTVFNLNPLIKLDGYYLLSDLLRIPNLNRKAIGYVRSRISRWLGNGGTGYTVEVPRRERRVYWMYGTLALTFSVLLLGCVMGSLYQFLTARYQAMGFATATAALVALLRRPLRPTAAQAENSPETVTRPSRWRRRLGVALVLLTSLAALMLIRIELTVSAPLTVLPVQYAEVRAGVEGIVEQVLVRENDPVVMGQIIARLSDRTLRPELEKGEADIAATAARLKMLQSGPRREEVELSRREVETDRVRWQRAEEQFDSALNIHAERLARAKTSVEKAETQFRAAGDELDRIQELVSNRVASAKELQDAVAQVRVREKELQESQGDLRVLSADDIAQFKEAALVAQLEMHEAQGRLDLLAAGPRVELVEATEAELARLETQRDHLAAQIQYLNVITPIAGVIATPRLEELVGRRVDKGDLIAKVTDLSRFRAEIAVPEKEMADLGVGQTVVAKARAFPSVSFRGSVTSIAPIASSADHLIVGRAVLVSAELEDPLHRLKPEMTGHAKIHCGKRRLIEVLTRRIVRYARVEFWSWW